MNKYFLNIIYSFLSKGITDGYRAGIKSIVDMNKEKMNYVEDPMFDVKWTKVDKAAVKRFKMEAFMVAGVGSYELQEELKKLGVDVMEGVITDFDTFELEARKKMMEYGVGLGDQPPTGWIETNLNTAITSSLHAARWNRLNDPDVTEVYPALQYKSQRDGRVRLEHQRLEGKVFMKDDVVWRTIYPPNGWNCRCYVEPVTADDELMKSVEKTTKETRKEYDGEVHEDFKHNSGMDRSIWERWLKMKLAGMPWNEVQKLKTLIRESKL